MRGLVFGSLLREYRERSGLSQRSLGRTCDFDPSYISRLEHGTRQATREAVDMLVNALNLDAYDRTKFIAAAGYMPVGSNIVTRPLLVDIDVLLNDTRRVPEMKVAIIEQLKGIKRVLEASA